ncbi:MAG: hypothetical protein RLN76_13130 [Phycisphaeraceae bacterium]
MSRSNFAVAALALSVLALPSQAATIFSDGVFNNGDWTASTVTNAGGAGSTTSEFQVLTGGSPNEYREIHTNLNASVAGGAVLSLNLRNAATYNPNTQGAISTIDYSEDSLNISQLGNGHATGLLIQQGGLTFVLRNPILAMAQPTFNTWSANAAPGLVALDLWEIDNAGILNSTSNPDFSTAGGVMQFGFYRGVSSGNFTGQETRRTGIDNWRVQINEADDGTVIPSPAAAPAGLLGLIGVATLRRRA